VLDDLRTDAQRQLDPFFGRDAPGVLYHYTGGVGLIGIIREKALWCTQVQYLNDSQELYHAAALVADCAAGKNSEFEVFDRVRDYANGFAQHRTLSRICVASFSEDSDDLGQWRGYGDRNGGFAIGFASDLLGVARQHQEETNRGGVWNLAPVLYRQDEQKAVASTIVGLIEDACRHAVREGLNRQAATDQGITVFLSLLLAIGPLLKHPKFDSEREWRLVSPSIPHGDGHLHFRAGKHLTPYCTFALCTQDRRLALEEIVVGPGPHQQLNREAAGALAFEHHVRLPVEPRLSSIPFRDW
jgi:hypothetical protein